MSRNASAQLLETKGAREQQIRRPIRKWLEGRADAPRTAPAGQRVSATSGGEMKSPGTTPLRQESCNGGTRRQNRRRVKLKPGDPATYSAALRDRAYYCQAGNRQWITQTVRNSQGKEAARQRQKYALVGVHATKGPNSA